MLPAEAHAMVYVVVTIHHVVMMRGMVVRVQVGATAFLQAPGLSRNREETGCGDRRRDEKTLEHQKHVLEEHRSGLEKAYVKRTGPSFVQDVDTRASRFDGCLVK